MEMIGEEEFGPSSKYSFESDFETTTMILVAREANFLLHFSLFEVLMMEIMEEEEGEKREWRYVLMEFGERREEVRTYPKKKRRRDEENKVKTDRRGIFHEFWNQKLIQGRKRALSIYRETSTSSCTSG